jgi:peptide/nickel transport system permease protein
MKKKKLEMSAYILALFIILAFIIIFSMISPAVFKVDLGAINLPERMLKPSIFGLSDSGHLLGTDYMGRDVFVRIWYSTRTSLIITFLGLLGALVLGVFLGVIAGLNGGRIDDVVMFLVNVRISIPPIIIGIVVVTIFGSGNGILILLITFVYCTNFARIVRAEIMHVRSENYIECSRAIGASSIRILFEHIIKNIASPLIVIATLNINSIILFESSMSFLGVGVIPPETSLGLMVSSGRNQMIGNPWLVVFPVIMIIIIVMSVSLIGDWLRDKLDPKLQSHV